MLIEGVKLSDGTVIPITLDDDGKLLVGGVTVDANGLEITNDAGNPIPVTGPITDAQLRASDVKVTLDSEAVVLGAGSAAIGKLTALPGLDIPAHDYIALSYTGPDLTGVVYKTGGSGGTTVATLTLAYTDGKLTSVTKS